MGEVTAQGELSSFEGSRDFKIRHLCFPRDSAECSHQVWTVWLLLLVVIISQVSLYQHPGVPSAEEKPEGLRDPPLAPCRQGCWFPGAPLLFGTVLGRTQADTGRRSHAAAQVAFCGRRCVGRAHLASTGTHQPPGCFPGGQRAAPCGTQPVGCSPSAEGNTGPVSPEPLTRTQVVGFVQTGWQRLGALDSAGRAQVPELSEPLCLVCSLEVEAALVDLRVPSSSKSLNSGFFLSNLWKLSPRLSC